MAAFPAHHETHHGISIFPKRPQLLRAVSRSTRVMNVFMPEILLHRGSPFPVLAEYGFQNPGGELTHSAVRSPLAVGARDLHIRIGSNRCRARQAQRGYRLHQSEAGAREIDHVLPLHRQVILIWKWYESNQRSSQFPIAVRLPPALSTARSSLLSAASVVASRCRSVWSRAAAMMA
jgi:hypothetical protein